MRRNSTGDRAPRRAWGRASRVAALAVALMGAALPALADYRDGLAAYEKHDWTTAVREFRPLAEQGHAAAQARLGHMLLNGLGTFKDEAEGVRLLKGAANAGEVVAQHWLGVAYFYGRGTPKDVTMALLWFSRAADKGDPGSLHAMGEINFGGLGVNKDESRGIEYFQKASDLGWAASKERLAQFNWDGRAMPSNKAKALEYARPAAEAGRPTAQFILGLASLLGQGGVAKDPSLAAQWFRKAADQGHPQSEHNLGVLYVTGQGVAKSATEGYFWMALGALRAPANLKQNYEKERDSVGNKLPPNEVAELRQKVAAWRPAQAGSQTGGAQMAPPQAAGTPSAQPAAPSNRFQTAAPSNPNSGKTSSGSGFVVTPDGVILTNAHVVENCGAITVLPQGGEAQIATVKAKDSVNDLALLQTRLHLSDVARFRQGKPLRPGDGVVVVGYPLSTLLSREPNVTFGGVSALNGMHGDPRHFQITAPVQKGNSGGPLADMSGNVVGIVSSKLNAMAIANRTGDIPQNINFAIKADLARSYMDSHNVVYQTAAPGADMSAADVGDRVRRFTVFIQCKIQ